MYIYIYKKIQVFFSFFPVTNKQNTNFQGLSPKTRNNSIVVEVVWVHLTS